MFRRRFENVGRRRLHAPEIYAVGEEFGFEGLGVEASFGNAATSAVAGQIAAHGGLQGRAEAPAQGGAEVARQQDVVFSADRDEITPETHGLSHVENGTRIAVRQTLSSGLFTASLPVRAFLGVTFFVTHLIQKWNGLSPMR